MQLIHPLTDVDIYYNISIISLFIGLAALIPFIIIFLTNKTKFRKQYLVVSSCLIVFLIILSVFCQIQDALLIKENREQIVQTFADEGYEVMNPDEITFTDHAIHEISIIEDNKDITKMAYRIGRCDCYFYIYKIMNESYINITPEEDL